MLTFWPISAPVISRCTSGSPSTRWSAPPFVLCVALDRTDGAFEANLASLKLTEGTDYFHFC